MALDTDISLRGKMIYSVFVRNHSPSGDFAGVHRDLDRIKELGTDIVWLMPFHPSGIEGRKGASGSPYAISDYRAIDSAHGTMADFENLVEGIHARGMTCMMDVVFNHTAPDSVLRRDHPEWYVRAADGTPVSRNPDWEDVLDLDFTAPELWDYHIETLRGWARLVDGFRCDVAPLVPVEFWARARREVAEVKPGVVWLAETVEPEFVRLLRSRGVLCHSDGEMYQAFDLTYDYDVINGLRDYALGRATLREYIGLLELQDSWYPENYVKLRFLENHDRDRIASLCPDPRNLLNWTAFLFFQKGATLIYAGQEFQETNRPSLFDPDPIRWDPALDISDHIRRLRDVVRDPLFVDGSYGLRVADGADTVIGTWSADDAVIVGVFPFRAESAALEVPELPEGEYPDLITGRPVVVSAGLLASDGDAVMVKVTG